MKASGAASLSGGFRLSLQYGLILVSPSLPLLCPYV